MLRDLLETYLAPRASLISWLLNFIGDSINESICWNILRQYTAEEFNNIRVFNNFLNHLDSIIADPINNHLLTKPMLLIEYAIYKDIDNCYPNNPFCLIGNSILNGYPYCNLGSSPHCHNPLAESNNLGEALCKFEPFSSFKMNAIYDNSLSYEDHDYYTEKVLNGDIPKPTTQLRGKRPFCWVTRREAIEDVIALKDTKRIIAELGLLHFVEKNEQFVLTTYPIDFKFSKLCKPTFIEGVRVPFRVDQSNELWGKTVNLLTGDFCHPEAVHCPHFRNHDFHYDKWNLCDNFIDDIDFSVLLDRGRL